ncbi:hypothetical protein Cadr_000021881 [Camelus dromedarius]|uniref:Uncharacterized protein n=1 Tax=Camelus dromedarius TaxID=9838 RepID=A0A5N4CT79_CAMDR|nr:hypothetical protein Cadr_000021881 [Camelus dromedarius]
MYLAKCHLLWEAEKTGIAGPEIQESDTRWGRGVFTKKQALPHLLLLFGLVVSMALIWHPTNKLAALLPLPYLAWLTVITSITYHL